MNKIQVEKWIIVLKCVSKRLYLQTLLYIDFHAYNGNQFLFWVIFFLLKYASQVQWNGYVLLVKHRLVLYFQFSGSSSVVSPWTNHFWHIQDDCLCLWLMGREVLLSLWRVESRSTTACFIVQRWGDTEPIFHFSAFLKHWYPLNITFIFEWCCCSSAALTRVKY